jgi:hypothetical protein
LYSDQEQQQRKDQREPSGGQQERSRSPSPTLAFVGRKPLVAPQKEIGGL